MALHSGRGRGALAAMSTPSTVASFEYRLQREPVGVVVLDAQRRIVSANPMAAALLARSGMDWRGADLVALHPEAARAKVKWLLDAAEASPDQPSGMTLTLPGVTLVSRVTALQGSPAAGFCMLFHQVDQAPVAPAPPVKEAPWLLKLPLSARGGLSLIDVADVVVLKAEGHYSRVVSETGDALCSLPLAELARRLDPNQFLRVHRSYLVNLRHARAVERRDGQWWLVMTGHEPSRVPVSRAHIDDLRRHLAI